MIVVELITDENGAPFFLSKRYVSHPCPSSSLCPCGAFSYHGPFPCVLTCAVPFHGYAIAIANGGECGFVHLSENVTSTCGDSASQDAENR